MLRYFYILVCIQLCFCTIYIDKPEYELRGRSVRSKTIKVQKKQTRSPKKARLVRFDVQKFMQKPDDDAVDYEPNFYRNVQRKRENRQGEPASYYGSLADSYGNHKENDVIDYLNKDHIVGVNTRSSSNQDSSARHFNLHSFMDDKSAIKSHSHEKVTSSQHISEYNKPLIDPEKKCAFRHMKMPFFSFNKSTKKAKRQKKRKLFSFSHKKHKVKKPNEHQSRESESRADEISKDLQKSRSEVKKLSKRSYDQLCPNCIKEILSNYKKKTTKSSSHRTKPKNVSKLTNKQKTTVLKVDTLDDSLDGNDNLSSERKKRNDENDNESEKERDRRLQELEEVEKKIANVHITAPTFTRVSFRY